MIVYATGFDAVTGAFDRIDITGVGGRSCGTSGAAARVTYLGVQTAGFPNLMMLAGPQGGSASTNFGRGIEDAVDWITGLLEHMPRARLHRASRPPRRPRREWVRARQGLYGMLLLRKAKSWFTGYNSNIEGHDIMRLLIYNGGAPRYRKRLAEVAAEGYRGFVFG